MDTSWSHPFPLDQCMTAESYSYSVNYMKSIISTIGHPPYMSNTYSFFNIVTMAMYTTLIQYQHNIVRHRRYFFDVNIVDFATSPISSLHRRLCWHFFDVYIVHMAMYTMLNRYWIYIGYIAERERCRHDVEQHCDVDDINMKEDARYRFDVGQYCYFDDVVYETG